MARKVRRYDFPDKKLALEVFTHDLEKLVRVAELGLTLEQDRKSSPALDVNWAIVKDWSEGSRYELDY